MKQSKKINWYIGLTTKTGELLTVSETAQKVATILAVSDIYAFNCSVKIGYYKGIQEQSLKVSLIDTQNIGERAVERIAGQFTDSFNQECVLVEIEDIKYNFC